MRLTNALKWFLGLALGLPALILVLQLAGTLLREMGDEAGAQVLRGVAVGGGVLWAVSLLGLLILVAIEAADRK